MPTNLRTTIDGALANGRLDLTETKKIIEAAGPTVTASEARQIGDVFDRATGAATASSVTATSTALRHLDQFFLSEQLPFGSNKERMRQDLQVRLENTPRGPARSKAPSTSSYTAVTLRDGRSDGEQRETLYINPTSRRGYLRVDGGGTTKAKWFGPYDTETMGKDRVTPLVAGQLSVDRATWIRTAMVDDLPHLAFDQASLPGSGKLVALGPLHVADGVVFSVFVPEGTPGGSLDASTHYVARREDGKSPPTYSALTTLAAFEDPATDGEVSPPMRKRARAQFMDREYGETHHWKTGGPDSAIKLKRTSVATYGDAYFVIGTAGGPLIDPDKATQVYFRHRQANMWSGPFPIEPLYI